MNLHRKKDVENCLLRVSPHKMRRNESDETPRNYVEDENVTASERSSPKKAKISAPRQVSGYTSDGMSFESPPDDELPDIDINLSSTIKRKKFVKGDIVWAPFMKKYWPAVVTSVKEKVCFLYVNEQNSYIHRAPAKRILPFDNPVKNKELKQLGEKHWTKFIDAYELVVKYLCRKKENPGLDARRFLTLSVKDDIMKRPVVEKTYSRSHSIRRRAELGASGASDDSGSKGSLNQFTVQDINQQADESKSNRSSPALSHSPLQPALEVDDNADNDFKTAKDSSDGSLDYEDASDGSKKFVKGDIVWAPFKKMYWPAVVTSVKENVCFLYVNEPNTNIYQAPAKRLMPFDNPVKNRELKQLGEKHYSNFIDAYELVVKYLCRKKEIPGLDARRFLTLSVKDDIMKRPVVEKTYSGSDSIRRRAELGASGVSDDSGSEGFLNQFTVQDINQQADESKSNRSSPALSHSPLQPALEVDDNADNDFKKAKDSDGSLDYEDASDGSSEGSSMEDPDEDLVTHLPSGPARTFKELTEVLDDEDDGSDNDSDGEDDGNTQLEEMDPLLYHGAPITLNESMLSVLALTFTYNLPRSCLDDVLQLVSLHCPTSNLYKDNVRLFKKHFSKSKSLVVRHYYCTTCFEGLKHKNQICGQCNEHRGVAFFAEIPVLPQLEALFGRPGFHAQLTHRFKRNKLRVGNYDDIYDGKFYKLLSSRGNILTDVNNISFTWYTNGVKLNKFSENKIWPFYFTINELPFSERHKPENALLAGIWFGRQKPVPHLFVKSFREDFHSLNKGVLFKLPELTDPILVKGIVLCGTCDLPMKSLFLNLSQPSSTFGCQKCKIRSLKKKNQAVYRFQRYTELRTYEESILHAGKAIKAGRSVYGVKGSSALSFVYKPIETTAIDMHDAYVGISRILNKAHFSEEYSQHPASLFGFLHLYDRRLNLIRPPYYVEKLPRSYFSCGQDWEPAELKVNLMIYSLPLLQDIMSVFHFEHHMLLVYGLYLLSKDSVSENCLELASEMLIDYCSRFQDLYGDDFLLPHIHQLIHLPSVVRDFGPLWVMSCAPYEGLNEMLQRFSQGNHKEETQVVAAASLFLHVSKLNLVQPNIGSPAHAFCEKLLLSRCGMKLKVHSMYGHFCVVGKMQHTPVLPEVVYVALAPLKLSGQNYCMFNRLLSTRKNILFTSKSFDEGTQNISSCVKYQKNNGAFFGRIHSFLRVTQCACREVCTTCDPSFYAIIHKLHTQPAYRAEPGGFIPFIHRCAEMNEYEAVRIECLSCVCFLIEIQDRHDAFVVEPITTGQ